MSDYDGPLIGWKHETQGETTAYSLGAAVAFGLMGMAEAIRVHYQCTLGHTWCGPAPADDVCVCCGHVGRLDTRDRRPAK